MREDLGDTEYRDYKRAAEGKRIRRKRHALKASADGAIEAVMRGADPSEVNSGA